MSLKKTMKRNYKIYNKANNKCFYCGVELNFSNRSIDHITPKCKGGAGSYGNLVPSCKTCNFRKGGKL